MRAPRGSVRQRGQESWELRVRMDGRRHSKTVRAATRELAEDALLDWRRELRDEGVPDRDPTVSELVAEWLGILQGRVKPRTRTRYEQLLRVHVVPVIGGVRVRSLRAGDMQRVIDRVLVSRSARTAHHVFRVLSELLAEAERWGIAPNVAKGVRPPRPRRPELRVPTVEETQAILRAVQGSIAEGPSVLAAGCGLRLGEALALRWPDVVLDRARLRITGTMYRGGKTEPKTGRARRSVEIPPFVVKHMRKTLAAQNERRLASVAWDGEYVFDRGGGIPLSIESVSRRFGQLAEGIGLGDVRFHDLRHGFATRLLEANVNPKEVSAALGHASVSITLDLYSHILPSISRRAAEAIEEVFGG